MDISYRVSAAAVRGRAARTHQPGTFDPTMVPAARVTSAFRLLTVIPIAIVLALVSGAVWTSGSGRDGDLNRWLPLVKWLLALPHHVVLFFLDIVAIIAVIGVWFAILFTGRYPREIFGFLEGVLRWHNRVIAYALLMVTDAYPPFRLARDAPWLQGDSDSAGGTRPTSGSAEPWASSRGWERPRRERVPDRSDNLLGDDVKNRLRSTTYGVSVAR